MKTIFNYTKALLLILSVVLFTASCSEDFMDEINKDNGHTQDCFAKFIIPDIELRTAQNVVGGDFNTYFGSYVEYSVGTFNQLYNAELRRAEVRTSTTFNNGWGSVYENIRNAKLVIEKCGEGGTDQGDDFAKGVAEILLAYNAASATDIFGDTPYSQVGDIVKYPNPEADSQIDIYKSVFELLDAGIADVSNGSNSLGAYDLIYGGRASSWVKFAKGLKARYTMRNIALSSDRNADYEKIVALVDQSFDSPADQASMQYDGNNQNPVFDFEWSRDYLAASQSLYDKLMARNDPRAERVYFDCNSWEHLSAADAVEYLAENGNPLESQYYYGYDVFQYAEVAPIHFLSYHELQFLKAEALCRLGNDDEAKEALKLAVEAAFENLEVNVEGAMNSPSLAAYGGLEPISDDALSSEDADSYFEAEVAPLFDENPLKEIMIQKYLGLWGANGEGVETYADVRRLKAEGKDWYDFANTGAFPLRAPYGNDDVTSNPNISKLYTDAGNYVLTENVRWAGGSR